MNQNYVFYEILSKKKFKWKLLNINKAKHIKL